MGSMWQKTTINDSFTTPKLKKNCWVNDEKSMKSLLDENEQKRQEILIKRHEHDGIFTISSGSQP